MYSSRATLESALRDTLWPEPFPAVAMEYSPRNSLPRVSRVDAGTVELVRSMGPDVISSADLMQYATQRWSPEQLAGHQARRRQTGTHRQRGLRAHRATPRLTALRSLKSLSLSAGVSSEEGPDHRRRPHSVHQRPLLRPALRARRRGEQRHRPRRLGADRPVGTGGYSGQRLRRHHLDCIRRR